MAGGLNMAVSGEQPPALPHNMTDKSIGSSRPSAGSKDSRKEFLKRQEEMAAVQKPEQVDITKQMEIMPHSELEALLGTSFKGLAERKPYGMTEAKAEERLLEEGANELDQVKPPGLFLLFITQLLNVLMLMLITSSVASLVMVAANPEERTHAIKYIEGIAILAIVIVNALIAAVTENRANNALAALAKMNEATCDIVRDGVFRDLNSKFVVRGDVVKLNTGDVVPADCRVLWSSELKVNEMMLTGEPDDVNKSAMLAKDGTAGDGLTARTMVYSSCQVAGGTAIVVATTVGMNTRIGAIAALLQAKDKKKNDNKCMGWCGIPDAATNRTPLQERLHHLGLDIGKIAIAVCAVVWIVGVILNRRDVQQTQDRWVYMTMIAITLAVAAIPEGLPLCVTISLSTGSSQMAKKNVMVRKLAAVETLGCASVICTDKTGTLTEGKMTMVKGYAGMREYDVSGQGFDPYAGGFTFATGEEKDQNATDDSAIRTMMASAVLCCSTTISKGRDETTGRDVWRPSGNSSEAPIVVAAAKLGFWTNDIEKEWNRVLEIPFNSGRKMMATISESDAATVGAGGLACSVFPSVTAQEAVKEGEDGIGNKKVYLSVVKGAPDIILGKCSYNIDQSGKAAEADDATKAKIMDEVDDLTSDSLRVIAVAVRVSWGAPPVDMSDRSADGDDRLVSLLTRGMTFVGLVASLDPPRQGVAESVADAQLASVRVVMITGSDFF